MKNLDNNIKFKILAVILIVILCIAITPITFQNDTYYTIKIGEHIQNYGIDMMDPYSWHKGLSYTYPHWLYDLLTYKIYSHFGFMGIYVVTCILSCILGLSIFFVNSKLSKSKIISFFVTVGTMCLLKDFIAARAQLVTFILFIFVIYFIEKFLESKKAKYGICIILISILIANLHVAVWPFLFILFLPYIGEYVVYKIISNEYKEKLLLLKIKLFKKKSKKYQDELEKININKTEKNDKIKNSYKIKISKNDNIKWLIIIMIICAFTGLLTPLGDTPYTYLIKTLLGNTTQNINEHLPMVLSGEPATLCTIIIFLVVLMFKKTRIKLCDLFMISGLALLMIMSVRQLSMFSLIGSIIFSKLIVELIESYNNDLFLDVMKKILRPIIILFMALSVGCLVYDNVKIKDDDKFVDETKYPVKACDYILKNIDLDNAKFYNQYNYGSYMIYRGIPVFIDSRADLYTPEFSGLKDDIFTDYIESDDIIVFYEDIFKKYNITHIILSSKSQLNVIISGEKNKKYHEIYKDNNFVIYERKLID